MYKDVLFVCLFCFSTILCSQNLNNRYIVTAFPLLTVAPDARASGLGGQGVATSSDAMSQHWNPAKYNFSQKDYGVSLSYVPYLKNITTDVALIDLMGYFKKNNRSSFSTGIKYFSFGSVESRTEQGIFQGSQKPYEASLEGSYSLLLSPNISTAITGRLLNSNLKNIDNDAAKVLFSYSFDMAVFYTSKQWRAGLNISNIGPKVIYQNLTKSFFIPTNLKLGVSRDFKINFENKISLSLEFNKLLVPTPPIKARQDTNLDGRVDSNDKYVITKGKSNDVNFLSGIFQSFSDAPGGFSEEVSEITTAFGTEYWYKDIFATRIGAFYQDPSKGDRKFISIGTGFKMKSVMIDFSYLYSYSIVRNPLDSNIKLSISVNLDK